MSRASHDPLGGLVGRLRRSSRVDGLLRYQSEPAVTSPPARVARPDEGRRSRPSFRKWHRAVGEQEVGSARVEAVRLLVVGAVDRTRPQRRLAVVAGALDHDRVGARRPGPADGERVGSQATRPPQHRPPGVFGDQERVQCAVGDLGQAAHDVRRRIPDYSPRRQAPASRAGRSPSPPGRSRCRRLTAAGERALDMIRGHHAVRVGGGALEDPELRAHGRMVRRATEVDAPVVLIEECLLFEVGQEEGPDAVRRRGCDAGLRERPEDRARRAGPGPPRTVARRVRPA